MTLPILLSVPHAGLQVPPEAEPYCQLTAAQIAHDGDEGAAEIYALSEHVAEFLTTDVARAIVDLNRAEDDRRADGVVKTHTCWDEPVYRTFPPEETVEELLDRYYRPYHARLSELARGDVRLGVDCHTMAAIGPPIGPMAGQERPHICLSNVDGTTLPQGWMDELERCFSAALAEPVAVNHPFRGGYITSTHGREMPWVQVELSRGAFMSNVDKRSLVLQALSQFCERCFESR